MHPWEAKICIFEKRNVHLWEAKYAPLRGKQDEDGPRSRLDHQGWLASLQGVSHCGTLGFGFWGWFHKLWLFGKTNKWELLEILVCEMYDYKNEKYQATVGVGEPVTEQARVMLRKVGLKRYLDPVSIRIKGKWFKNKQSRHLPEARAATTAGGISFRRTNSSPP